MKKLIFLVLALNAAVHHVLAEKKNTTPGPNHGKTMLQAAFPGLSQKASATGAFRRKWRPKQAARSEVMGKDPTVSTMAPKGLAHMPATLVAVFSRRNSAERRSLVRDMWLKVQYASRGKVTVKFVLCSAADGLDDAISKEHTIHGDIFVLSCEEGSQDSLLTKKTLMAMRGFRERFPQKELFMKIHDDSFVRWSRFSSFLSENAAQNVYMGVLRPPEAVCRNSSHPNFVHMRAFPSDSFPDSMASTTGVILGRGLVERILDAPEDLLLQDDDRAMGLWVNRQKKRHGYPVRYLQLDAQTADEDVMKTPIARPRTWGSYPYVVHHGLAGESIACLTLAEGANMKGRSIDECFAIRNRRALNSIPPCKSESVLPNLLQRQGKGTVAKRDRSEKGSGSRIAKTTRPTVTKVSVRPEVASLSGSRVDWKTHRQRLTFVHIPKNGGTAIEQAGQAGGVWWPRKWLTFWHGLTMPDGSVCEKYHVPPQYLRALNDHDWGVFDDPGTFCVTRHPYDRAVSEYKYMLSVAWGRSMSQLYNTGLYDKPRCTVEGLNYFLTKALQNALGGKRFQHDCHMLPQSEFIWGRDGKQWCKHILRTENMESGFNALMEKYRYPMRLNTTTGSTSHGKINNSSDACHGLSTQDLSMSTRRLLDALYKPDFQQLNYSQSHKDFVFMRIPRNFGNLLESAAATEQRATWPSRRKSFKEARVQMPESSWCDKIDAPLRHLEPEDSAFYQNKEIFCIARHPYERVVSAYNMVAGMKDRAQMLNYYNVPAGDASSVCSRPGLNNFVQNAIASMRGGRTFAMDCQMAPQHFWIWDANGEQVCNHIVHAGNLPDALDALLMAKGFIDVNITSYMKSGAKPKAACHMSQTELSPESRKLVDIFYAEDFARLGYTGW